MDSSLPLNSDACWRIMGSMCLARISRYSSLGMTEIMMEESLTLNSAMKSCLRVLKKYDYTLNTKHYFIFIIFHIFYIFIELIYVIWCRSNHFLNKFIDLILPRPKISSSKIRMPLSIESSFRTPKLKRPTKVISLFEMRTTSVKLMNEVLHTNDISLGC